MENIIIPALNIKLSSVVIRKAEESIHTHLPRHELSNLNYQLHDNRNLIYGYICNDYALIHSKEQKLLFISIVLQHLDKIDKEITAKPDTTSFTADNYARLSIENLQYELHAEINNLGYNIDDNQFTSEEVSDLNSKIQEIISKLDELRGGHEVLFERIEELKDDFKDIQTTIPLGKKTTIQRMGGFIVPYIGQKGADEIYNIISPIVTNAIKGLPTLLS